MIPNHKQFVEAIQGMKKVCVRYYSKAGSEVLDRVCAPMDYGPGRGIQDGLNRYWLWDYASNTGSHLLGLVPQQITGMQVLAALFDPAQLKARPPHWFIPRNWDSQPQPKDEPIIAPAPLTVTALAAGGQGQRSETAPASKE